MNKLYKIIRYIFILVLLVFVFLFIKLMNDPHQFWSYIENNKLIPRVISWTSLFLGLYGIARRRFSPSMTVFLFFLAFFFAYLGRFIFKGMY